MTTAERHRILHTPTGDFVIHQRADGSIETGWLGRNGMSRKPRGVCDSRLLPDLAKRIRAYFAGEVVSFGDVPVPGASAFMRQCWKVCRAIPRGETISYAELARRAGSPGAARAAGQAMRRNPQPIVTPCHRVIGSAGKLHGFAGTTSTSSDALATKRFLLQLEGGEISEAHTPKRGRQHAA